MSIDQVRSLLSPATPDHLTHLGGGVWQIGWNPDNPNATRDVNALRSSMRLVVIDGIKPASMRNWTVVHFVIREVIAAFEVYTPNPDPVARLVDRLVLAAFQGNQKIENGDVYRLDVTDREFSAIVPEHLEDQVLSVMFSSGLWSHSVGQGFRFKFEAMDCQ